MHDFMVTDGPGDGVLYAHAVPGKDQIHVYANAGNDHIYLNFVDAYNHPEFGIMRFDGFAHGHHVFAEPAGLGGIQPGYDNIYFVNTANVGAGASVVGRLQDFDNSRDKIFYEGDRIDLYNLPSNMRIISFKGAHNDPGADDQQWLHIRTASGGNIVYALEGARADMTGDGGSNGGNMEFHFLNEQDLNDMFHHGRVVDYFDPVNYVPEGFSPDGGEVIVDIDLPHNASAATKVLTPVLGTAGGDLIAAGLNDDRVKAGAGDDRVWGGSGDDTLSGDGGRDTLWASTGKDMLWAGADDDVLIGSRGGDFLHGGTGNDIAAYWEATAGVLADLQNCGANSGEASGDIYVSIENLQGSAFADDLRGDSGTISSGAAGVGTR